MIDLSKTLKYGIGSFLIIITLQLQIARAQNVDHDNCETAWGLPQNVIFLNNKNPFQATPSIGFQIEYKKDCYCGDFYKNHHRIKISVPTPNGWMVSYVEMELVGKNCGGGITTYYPFAHNIASSSWYIVNDNYQDFMMGENIAVQEAIVMFKDDQNNLYKYSANFKTNTFETFINGVKYNGTIVKNNGAIFKKNPSTPNVNQIRSDYKKAAWNYYNQHNYEQAFIWFQKGSNVGDMSCRLMMAYCYETGKGVQKDTKKALGYYSLILIYPPGPQTADARKGFNRIKYGEHQ